MRIESECEQLNNKHGTWNMNRAHTHTHTHTHRGDDYYLTHFTKSVCRHAYLNLYTYVHLHMYVLHAKRTYTACSSVVMVSWKNQKQL